MKRVSAAHLVFAMVLLLISKSIMANDSADNSITAGIFKYNGTRPGSAGGKAVLMLQLAPRIAGAPLSVAIPNNDPDSAKADPNTAAMGVIKDLKAGDLVKIRYNKSKSPGVLEKIEKATARPGDNDPESAEFIKLCVQKNGDQEYQCVLIRKTGKELPILVPNKKSDDGKTAPDGDVLSQVQKFVECDYIDIETAQAGGNTFIKSIKPYEAPKSASFIKLNPPEKGANPPLNSVEIKDGDKAMTVYIRPGPAGGASDPAMLAKVRGLKASQAILFKVTEESGKQYLADIRVDVMTSTVMTGGAGRAGGEIILNGTFEWTGRKGTTPALKAVITPNGANEWKAVFTFEWDRKPRTYVGTITGNLKNGPVECKADGDNRHFGFKGTATNGVLVFDCFETFGANKPQKAQGKGTLK